MWKGVIGFFCILILILILILYDCPQRIVVLNAHETWQVIAKNHDFYKQLTPEDWKLRTVQNVQEYIERTRGVCVTLTKREEQTLAQLCRSIDAQVRQMKIPFIDSHALASLPWKVGVFRDTSYEFGYPHTIGDVILINLELFSDHDTLSRTLLHEKVHIYQRRFPERLHAYMSRNGFRKWKRRDQSARPNPDLDEWMYTKNGHPYRVENASRFDASIDSNPQFYEHPYERMAIEVSRMLKTPI